MGEEYGRISVGLYHTVCQYSGCGPSAQNLSYLKNVLISQARAWGDRRTRSAVYRTHDAPRPRAASLTRLSRRVNSSTAPQNCPRCATELIPSQPARDRFEKKATLTAPINVVGGPHTCDLSLAFQTARCSAGECCATSSTSYGAGPCGQARCLLHPRSFNVRRSAADPGSNLS